MQLQLGQFTLSRPNTIKGLGILFESKLTYISHFTSLISFLFLFCAIRRIIERKKPAFRTRVIYKLEYASVVWSPIYGTNVINLQKVQRRFLKILHYKFVGTYPPRGFPQYLPARSIR